MTINLADNTPRIEYSVAQGVVQTVFAVPFEFFDNGDLTVYVDGVQKYEGSDFSISGGDGSTGSITFNTAVPPEVQQVTGAVGGSTVVIVRDIAIERTTDFTSNAINRAALNTQLDTIIGMIADLDDKASRTLQISDYEVAPNISLPSIEDRAGRVIAFDENGNTIAGPTADEVINGEEYATQSAASAAAAALSATAAATSETNAETSETAAAASAAAALISEDAAAASESAADASAISAAQNEALATAAADAAGTYATNSANSATAAATSAIDAATSETNAATSATNAATSETNAAGSATAAAASQVAAAASAASAANSYDLFDDRYLGSKTADPTLDNDGNALVAGALYFNSTANEMRVYDGANWIAASSAGGASLLNYNYTATAGQTTFSGADDNAATLSYTQQNLIVTLNGIVLEDGTDYTADNGTSVVLASGAAAGDELNIVAFKSFTVADTYSIAQADATFATAAQGALAETAVQPSDDVTLGAVTATSFSGDGSGLSNLPAASKTYIPFLITSSGTFVAQGSGTLEVYAVGGGGSGGGQEYGQEGSCSGGGAGGTAFKEISISKNDVVSITIGAGAPSIAVSNIANGSAGGTTTVTGPNLSLTAYGGAGGVYTYNVSNVLAAGGAGGSATGGTINLTGGRGGDATNTDGASGAAGSGGLPNFDGFDNMTSGLSDINGTDVVTAGYAPSRGITVPPDPSYDKKFSIGWAGFTDPAFLPQNGTGNAVAAGSGSGILAYAGTGTLGSGGGGCYIYNTSSGNENCYNGGGGDGFCLIIAKYNN